MEPVTDVVRRGPAGDNPVVGERGASTQRRILRAALGTFAEHGFHDTHVELITEAAGCSRPAFYQYFSSKDDVFWRLAGHLADDMGRLAESIDAITPDTDGVEHLRRWLDAFIDLCSEYAPILAGYQEAARSRRPAAGDTRGIGDRVGVALLRAAGPGVAGLDRPALTNTLVAVVMRAISFWQLGLGGVGRARFVDGLARTVHRTLHGGIDGVNLGPPAGRPPRRRPRWPAMPGRGEERALRARGRQTRQQLLDAGRQVLPERGYHETRVDDIVRAAGVSHGSFYRYFANKDDLFRELAVEAASAMVELTDTFPDGAGADPLQRWLEDWFGTYRRNGGVIGAWQEIGAQDPELAAFSIEIAVVAFDRLTRIVDARGFGDATVDALALLAVVERVPYSVLVLGHVAEDEAVDASALVVRRGLFGAGA